MRNSPSTPRPASPVRHAAHLHARQDDICLPSALLSSVPSCAVPCIQFFANTNYPGSTCADTTNLDYLCTRENTSDLTIGEGSVQCVKALCRGSDQDNVSVYNVCGSVRGALPNLASTITATLVDPTAFASGAMETLPATIGSPATTESVSMIVMDTGSHSIPSGSASGPLTDSGTFGTSAAYTTGHTTPGSAAITEQAAGRDGLTTAQIAGIAAGGAGFILAAVGLFMFILCMRKRRRERRRSQRRSRVVDAPPPPVYQSPLQKQDPPLTTDPNSLTVPMLNGRFYAPPSDQGVEEKSKRRSFWRKSIKPEDIGVAVSPQVPGEISPVSVTSQQSSSRLLPTFPARALWPDPLNVQGSGRRQPAQPMSDVGSVGDIESAPGAADAQSVYVDNQPFDLLPVRKKQRVAPPPLQSPAVVEASNGTTKAQRAPVERIPLTPTYDNGNISVPLSARGFGSPNYRSSPSRSEPVFIALKAPEHQLPPSSSYANRKVLKKSRGAGPPPTRTITPLIEPSEQLRTAPTPQYVPTRDMQRRSGSLSSELTEIEEDTTPEESDRQLELSALPRTEATGLQSPLKDLRYPNIPRSAAVSRQAETPPMPKMQFNPSNRGMPLRLTRDQLIRAEASFMKTDSTSSDGYLSDSTIEFPAPPGEASSISYRINREPLRMFKNESAASRDETGTILQRSPSGKAKLTPSKSKSGDLYLTVSI
ncbi:hypothetical protein PV10_01391 [Exophiala mesophila]|uniref:Extracellular membrane protein CFEM domain-containing protein n=1 Tax=Exophiala mesophila TaxID=212818 RepID=A0A0D1X754_EXOME|nr:uncharacterized protein PV10_01391 [Exophiala mesophila]KIV97675.1 hypothetical protein PV10_01391 [Exophiala mesophila]